MKAFPKPLTAEEEACCLERCQNGDEEARRLLIEHNLRLVAHVARKYQGCEEDPDDLISIGTIGLIKAVSTFDSKKNSRLGTYAAKCIDNELLMLMRSRKKTAREVSLYDPIGTDREGNEISLLDILEGETVDIPEKIEPGKRFQKPLPASKKNAVPKGAQSSDLALRHWRQQRDDSAGDCQDLRNFQIVCFQD